LDTKKAPQGVFFVFAIIALMEDRQIVIAGASSGLGAELAKLLSTETSHLYLLARSIESQDLPFSATKINCDARDVQSIKDAFKKIDEKTKRIDVLINCVGRGLVKGLEETTTEEIADVIDTNLKGGIFLSQFAYQRMIPHHSGHIINVSSTSGIKARPDETIYCATKWGLRGFTESLRLAAIPNKIRVTGIYPGGMKTPFWKGGEARDLSGFMDPKVIAQEIIKIINSPMSVSLSEVVLERGF